MGRQSLGRGLDAILGDHRVYSPEPDTDSGNRILDIDLASIDPNPFQPRQTFADSEIAELAETIKQHGLIQPVSLRRVGDRYQIIAGERRMRACKSLGMPTISAQIHERLSDKKMAEWALIENIQRVGLSPIEECRAYHQLVQDHGYKHEELATVLGKSRSAITNTLRLSKLPEEIQEWIHAGKLSAGHASALLSPEVQDPSALARKIMETGASVREAEQMRQELTLSRKDNKKPKTSKPTPDAQVVQLETKLREALGSEIRIQAKRGKGKIEILFHDNAEFARLHNLLLSLEGR